MSYHDQLTVREIRGPYMQLLTNLQGENGREWLAALNAFNSRKNPWVEDLDENSCRSKVNALVEHMAQKGKVVEALYALACALQLYFHCGGDKCGIDNAFGFDYIMRGVSVALEEYKNGDRAEWNRNDYIVNNIRQGADCLEKWLPKKE